MWRAFCAFALFVCGCFENASAESLYVTLPPRPQSSFGANTSFVFIAPYITRAETTLTASISKVSAPANSSSTQGKEPQGGSGNSTAAAVSRAYWQNVGTGQIVYQVSCDLTSVLPVGGIVVVNSTMPKEFGVDSATIVQVTPTRIVANAPNPNKPYQSGGVVANANCPAAPDSFAVTLTVTPTPVSRGYLYLRRNAFFDDSVDFSVSSNGMLSSSDTSSVQEITGILTELAQTAAAVAGAAGGGVFIQGVLPVPASKQPQPNPPEAGDQQTIDQLVNAATQKDAVVIIMSLKAQNKLAGFLQRVPTPSLALILKKAPLKYLILCLAPKNLADVVSELGVTPSTELTDVLNSWDLTELTRYMSSANLGEFVKSLWPGTLAAVLQKTLAGGVVEKINSADLAAALDGLLNYDAENKQRNLVVFLTAAPEPALVNKLQPAELGKFLNSLSLEDLATVLSNLPAAELVKRLLPDDLNAILIKASKETRISVETEISQQAAQKRRTDLAAQGPGICYRAIGNLVNSGPFYAAVGFQRIASGDIARTPVFHAWIDVPHGARGGFVPTDAVISWVILVGTNPGPDDGTSDTVSVRFALRTSVASYGQEGAKTERAAAQSGFVAFFPVPAITTSECVIRRHGAGMPDDGSADLWSVVPLNAPTVVNLYTESHRLDPQRDFLTNPHDTFTFTAGLITGHKFTGQSAAKTIVDTITMPIRSIMPSVTVTQSVQVQRNASGQITQTTNSTQTATGAPKGP